MGGGATHSATAPLSANCVRERCVRKKKRSKIIYQKSPAYLFPPPRSGIISLPCSSFRQCPSQTENGFFHRKKKTRRCYFAPFSRPSRLRGGGGANNASNWFCLQDREGEGEIKLTCFLSDALNETVDDLEVGRKMPEDAEIARCPQAKQKAKIPLVAEERKRELV